MPFGLLRAGGGLLSGPVMWIIGAAVVALVITGLQMIRNSGYAAAEASNLRGVAMAEREARERSATDVEWLQQRQGQAQRYRVGATTRSGPVAGTYQDTGSGTMANSNWKRHMLTHAEVAGEVLSALVVCLKGNSDAEIAQIAQFDPTSI